MFEFSCLKLAKSEIVISKLLRTELSIFEQCVVVSLPEHIFYVQKSWWKGQTFFGTKKLEEKSRVE